MPEAQSSCATTRRVQRKRSPAQAQTCGEGRESGLSKCWESQRDFTQAGRRFTRIMGGYIGRWPLAFLNNCENLCTLMRPGSFFDNEFSPKNAKTPLRGKEMKLQGVPSVSHASRGS